MTNLFDYLYDFGDSWEHEVTLVASGYINPELQSAIECLDGARSCPPEGVGSVPGYYEFCKALNDSDHDEHEGCMEWSGGGHDGEKFNIDEVNRELMKYQRWSRDRLRTW